MKSLYAARIITAIPKFNSASCNKIPPKLNFSGSSQPIRTQIDLRNSHSARRSQSPSNPLRNEQETDEEEDPDAQVQDLTVPEHWSVPSKALEVYNSLFPRYPFWNIQNSSYFQC